MPEEGSGQRDDARRGSELIRVLPTRERAGGREREAVEKKSWLLVASFFFFRV